MPILERHGIRYETHPLVYDPSDDTDLILASVRVGPRTRFLEIGTGTGLVAIHAARQGARCVATDVNPHAVRLARANARLNHVAIDAVHADLDRGLAWSRFDALAFNPPYLPTEPTDRVGGPLDLALDGGPDGRRTFDRFLGALARHRPPRAWVLVSSLQSPPITAQTFETVGYRARVEASKRLSFETLTVLELSDGRSETGPA